jgi:hypothetical protein
LFGDIVATSCCVLDGVRDIVETFNEIPVMGIGVGVGVSVCVGFCVDVGTGVGVGVGGGGGGVGGREGVGVDAGIDDEGNLTTVGVLLFVLVPSPN